MHKKFMRIAIAKARRGIRAGQTPFGACIVKGRRVLACAHNRVWRTTDITTHAEITAIREACRKLKTIDLAGCVIYSTCEPCPMCFSACHWARIARIIYGTRIRDAQKIGFSELAVSNKMMKRLAGTSMRVSGGFLGRECFELFRLWSKQKKKRAY